ncbi:peptide-N(4)-(N-acetyl-beta-glucosaminyl)asparagine amidase-like [Haliotis asinina]|uniref:peptide-N(4)-(N-acetyl-beta- glucosaminyl)asparagine amidase-like n=1 Tax=Haliotis asinina TaxID=109174 RepID=UPI0035327E08
MASTWDSVSQLLTENSKEIFIETSELLIKFASNILKKPNEAKYRKIRLGNPIVQSKLLPISGALEVLFEMGFLEDGEYLTMPLGSGLNTLRLICAELQSQRKKLGAPVLESVESVTSHHPTVVPQPSAQMASTATSTMSISTQAPSSASTAMSTPSLSPQAPRSAATASAQQTMSSQDVHEMESVFFSKIQSSMSHVMMYEDRTLQQKAREVIPLEQLQKAADANWRSLIQECPAGRGEVALDRQDTLLLELLGWFKKSFFQWVDAPPCNACGAETRLIGGVDPLPQERIWGASRVENYRCNSCQQHTRFPRYNHPQKLLETRRGRCGEWANCFTLCCRAVGFEARYVLDWTDHVWTEVYSNSQRRWLHCDPCENVCDKPLLYEAGWGKKLTYIIAFSKDEVLDVTWRYSSKHPEVLSRRKECRENWLCSVLTRQWNKKVNALSTSRKNELLNRLIIELVEFLTPKTADGQHLSGRTTGSLAWRQARGEIGRAESTDSSGSFIFTLTQEEKEREVCHVKYNCAEDKYVRLSSSNLETAGWLSCVHKTSSVFRKEERDWKMVYLSRTEGAARGSVSWKFDFKESGLRVNRCLLKADSSVFESGNVMWTICGDDKCVRMRGPDLVTLTEVDVKGCVTLTITADLKGGNGDNAWQHAQLFRQEMNADNSPFEVKISLA